MSRHRINGRKLGRNTNQRKALFKGLLNSLIIQEELKTTQTKAKAVQRLFDQLVTKAKPSTVHARRLLHAFLGNKSSVNKLVDDLIKRFGQRQSGFTRVTNLGLRRGDNAQIVKLELVDKSSPDLKQTQETTKSPKKTTKKPTKKTSKTSTKSSK